MNEVSKVEGGVPATTPDQLLQIAVEKGADLAQLEKLMDLQERWQANEARKAYVVAMNAFKQDPPELFKNKPVDYGTTHYRHATLDHIANKISEAMSDHGLSFRWETEQEGEGIRVTCTITHELGHSERVSLQAAPDNSGGKNSIQAIGSTVSYLERYTLLAATGLATQEMDDDGAGSVDPLNADQVANLEALIEEVGADKAAYLEYLKVEKLSDVPATWYDRCIQMLEAKRKKS